MWVLCPLQGCKAGPGSRHVRHAALASRAGESVVPSYYQVFLENEEEYASLLLAIAPWLLSCCASPQGVMEALRGFIPGFSSTSEEHHQKSTEDNHEVHDTVQENQGESLESILF